jgi:UDPglucose 6-dehydrogenase
MSMNIAVVGAGYVGLVTAACLADLGNRVLCVENNPARLAMLLDGQMPIYEEGLAELVQRGVCSGQLSFGADLTEAVHETEVVFLCVGTPPGPGGQPDLSQIESVATAIGQALDGRYRVIVTKSTVPVGSGDWVSLLIREAFCESTGGALHWIGSNGSTPRAVEESLLDQPRVKGGVCMSISQQSLAPDLPTDRQPLDASPHTAHFDVVSNPEFLREGSAICDMMFPDRIVLGSGSLRALSIMRELYRPLIEQTFEWAPPTPALQDWPRRQGPVPLVETDLASAEMIKYAANAFLATKISFINEIANICERTGADVRSVARGIGLDHRIGQPFLQAGIGWGGSCFPKDVAALAAMAADYDYEARLLTAVREVNARQRLVVVHKLQERLKILKGKTIGLLGLAFKPGTDDLRDAPSLTLANRLLELGAKVRAYDPYAASGAVAALPLLSIASDIEQLATDADALVLVTEWPEFRELPFAALARRMRTPIIVDGRNCLDRQALAEAGIEYIGIGR